MEQSKEIVVHDGQRMELTVPWSDTKIAIRSSMGPADTIRIKANAIRLEEVGDKAIEITDVIQHMVEMPDADGVLQACVRTVLVDKNKVGYAAISKGVYDSIFDLMYLRNAPPPWDPPVKCNLQINRTGLGRRVYRIVPAVK
jgi:hypothetical protein